MFPQDFFQRNSLITCHPASALHVPAPAPPAPTLPAPAATPLHKTQDYEHMCLGAVGGELERGPWSPNLFAWGREHSIFSPDWWAAVRKQAAVEGDEDLLHTFPFPGIYQPHQPPRWEILPCGIIKELHHSPTDNGISISFSTNLLGTLVNSYNLAPQDIKKIAPIMLMSIQFTVWMLEWRELCTV